MICLHRAASELSLCLPAIIPDYYCSFLNAQCTDLVLTSQEKQGAGGFLTTVSVLYSMGGGTLFLYFEFSKDKHL